MANSSNIIEETHKEFEKRNLQIDEAEQGLISPKRKRFTSRGEREEKRKYKQDLRQFKTETGLEETKFKRELKDYEQQQELYNIEQKQYAKEKAEYDAKKKRYDDFRKGFKAGEKGEFIWFMKGDVKAGWLAGYQARKGSQQKYYIDPATGQGMTMSPSEAKKTNYIPISQPWDYTLKVPVKPTFAYKHPLTGEKVSTMPEFAPKGHLPVPIDLKTGKESQSTTDFLRMRSFYPQMQEKLKLPDSYKSWYQKSGRYRSVPQNILSESGDIMGQALVPEELTWGEVISQKIRSAPITKTLTKSQKSETERKQHQFITGLAFAPLSSGASIYQIGSSISPSSLEKAKYKYKGELSSAQKFQIGGKQTLSTGLKTYGSFTAFGQLGGGLVGGLKLGNGLSLFEKYPKVTKVISGGLTTLYGAEKVKEYIHLKTPEEKQMFAFSTAGELGGYKALSYVGRLKYKREYKNYQTAKKEYDKIKRISKYAEVVKSEKTFSLGTKLNNLKISQELSHLNIKPEILSKVKSIEITQSTGEIIQNIPIMKKIAVPKTSKLFKKLKNIYSVQVLPSKKYKNIVSYTLHLEGRLPQTYSYFTFSKKPLYKFKNYMNALKYGSGKHLIITTPSRDKGFLLSKSYKYSKGKYKPSKDYISKITEGFLGKTRIKKITVKQKGNIADTGLRINIPELFKLSPKVGEGILKLKSKHLGRKSFIDKSGLALFDLEGKTSQTLSKSFKVTLDTSTAQKWIKDLKKIKSPKSKTIIKSLSNKIQTATSKDSPIIKVDSKNIQNIKQIIKTSNVKTHEVVSSIPIELKIRTRVPKPTQLKPGITSTLLNFKAASTLSSLKRSQLEKQKQLKKTSADQLIRSSLVFSQASKVSQSQKTSQRFKNAMKSRSQTSRSQMNQVNLIETVSHHKPSPPLRPPSIPFLDLDYTPKKRIMMRKKGKTKKGKKKYLTLPTGFESIMGVSKKSKARQKVYTGFESMRFT